ncbi:AP-5 complex subunit beta-1 [Trichoplax sp. H2]|nr:AP-5 complex subunit beta-1 [Trichoplax sp. H2]|eukprot:RDD38026.1 AP-5 complex subunit beta-1 [Trichoplax sp. H2]
MDRWSQLIDTFRYSTDTLRLQRQGIDLQDLLLDILQLICSDSKDINGKIKAMSLLQERADILLVDETSQEQAIASLLGVLQQIQIPETVFPTYIMITITSLVIQFDIKNVFPDLFATLIQILLNRIDRINSGTDRILRGLACQCLTEIEQLYPGLLGHRLDYYYNLCQAECSHIFQHYWILFTTVLKNAIQCIIHEPRNNLSLKDLFNGKLESSKALLEKNLSFTSNLEMVNSAEPLLSDDDSNQLKAIISFVMDSDNFMLLTPTGQMLVVLKLVECVTVSRLSQKTFKLLILQKMVTCDLPSLQSVMLLKMKCGDELFNQDDDYYLLERLVLMIRSPMISQEQQLIYCEWIMHFPDDSKPIGMRCTKDISLPYFWDYNLIVWFYPQVYDNFDIILRKLIILNHSFELGESRETTTILIGCLTGLMQRTDIAASSLAVTTLLRVFYNFCQRFLDSNKSLSSSMCSCVLTIVKRHPNFTIHILNFIRCISDTHTGSGFQLNVLKSLTDYIASVIPMTQVLPNLLDHLRLLEVSAQEKEIKPMVIVQFLQNLLETSDICQFGMWKTGQAVLSICRCIMINHDTTYILKDLCEVLMKMKDYFNDVDIKDQAYMYYCLLTSVSNDKLRTILSAGSSNNQLELISKIVVDDISKLSKEVDLPVIEVDDLGISLAKVPKNMYTAVDFNSKRDRLVISYGDIVREEGLLDHYFKQLTSSEELWTINVECFIYYKEDLAVDYEKKYVAIVLELESNSNYKSVNDVTVSFLSKEISSAPNPGCQTVIFKIQSVDPLPCTLNIKATVTDNENRTCIAPLDPLSIEFQDVILPLALPTDYFINDNEVLSKRILFEQLWSYIEGNQCKMAGDGKLGAISICCLNQADSQELQDTLVSTLSVYVIDQTDEIWIGWYLPPRYHVLLKCYHHLDHYIKFVIATDYWKLLTYVDDYLHKFEKLVS